MTTLQEYFGLQLTLFRRQLIEFGLNPVAGFILILMAFYGFSVYLFSRTEFAPYFYVLIGVSIMLPLSEKNRNDFLKFTYSKKNYFTIRILENLLIATPFILFLCYQQVFYLSVLLAVVSTFISFLKTNKKLSPTIPTPFFQKPFEFIVGFRKSLIGFLIAYFLTAMSVTYENFHLGIFSLVLVFLLCLSFYFEPEIEFYVWVHALKVNGFLFDKVKTAIIFSTILSLPITIALLIFFPGNSKAVIGFQAIGYCYLLTIILAKYSTYPHKMNLPQGILFALGITMPPLLVALVPFFYFQSKKRLKEILE